MPNETKNSKNLLEKIKSRGYYKIRFIPEHPLDNSFFKSMKGSELYQFFINTVVSLRGWDYPCFPTSQVGEKFYRINEGYESYTEFGYFKEVWRVMDSGQFVHFNAFREDWGQDNKSFGEYQNIPPMKCFNIIDCIQTITEIFIFLRNLFAKNFYTDDISITVNIELNNLKDRKLWHFDTSRLPILENYICKAPLFPLKRANIGKDKINQDYINLATDCIVEIHRIFNWTNFSVPNIREIQNGLLNRKF